MVQEPKSWIRFFWLQMLVCRITGLRGEQVCAPLVGAPQNFLPSSPFLALVAVSPTTLAMLTAFGGTSHGWGVTCVLSVVPDRGLCGHKIDRVNPTAYKSCCMRSFLYALRLPFSGLDFCVLFW